MKLLIKSSLDNTILATININSSDKIVSEVHINPIDNKRLATINTNASITNETKVCIDMLDNNKFTTTNINSTELIQLYITSVNNKNFAAICVNSSDTLEDLFNKIKVIVPNKPLNTFLEDQPVIIDGHVTKYKIIHNSSDITNSKLSITLSDCGIHDESVIILKPVKLEFTMIDYYYSHKKAPLKYVDNTDI